MTDSTPPTATPTPTPTFATLEFRAEEEVEQLTTRVEALERAYAETKEAICANLYSGYSGLNQFSTYRWVEAPIPLDVFVARPAPLPIGPAAALALGAAAVVINNPVVTRRGLFGGK